MSDEEKEIRKRLRKLPLCRLESGLKAVLMEIHPEIAFMAMDFICQKKSAPDGLSDYLKQLDAYIKGRIEHTIPYEWDKNQSMYRTVDIYETHIIPYGNLVFADRYGKLPPLSFIRQFLEVKAPDGNNWLAPCDIWWIDMEAELREKLFRCEIVSEEKRWFEPEFRTLMRAVRTGKQKQTDSEWYDTVFRKDGFFRRLLEAVDEDTIGEFLMKVRPAAILMEDAEAADRFMKNLPAETRFDVRAAAEYYSRLPKLLKDRYGIVERQRHFQYVAKPETTLTDSEVKALSDMKLSVEVKEHPCSGFRIEENFVAGKVRLNYWRANYTKLEAVNDGYGILEPEFSSEKTTVEITGRHRIWVKRSRCSSEKGTKVYPASLYDLANQAVFSKSAEKFWLSWFDMEAQDNPFMKDAKALFVKWVKSLREVCIRQFTGTAGTYSEYLHPSRNDKLFCNVFPVQMDRLLKCHNWNEYFHTYKGADKLDTNFNKLLPEVSYAAIKVLPILKADSIPYLRSFLPEYNRICKKDGHTLHANEHYILTAYYEQKGIDNAGMVNDYITMSHYTRRKVSLKMKSEKTIADVHDELETMCRMNQMPQVKIPKNTKFDELRKLLPDSFEWIRDKKRLAKESELQSNCVWSYADRINEDVCAIYSYVEPSTGNRHTIEIRPNALYGNQGESGYNVVQVKTRFNRDPDQNTVATLMKYLGAKALEEQMYVFRDRYAARNLTEGPFGFDEDGMEAFG